MTEPQTVSTPTSPPLALSRGRSIAQYILIALFFWMSLYLYVPTLPTYAASKTDSLAFLGIILAQYGLWQAVVRLPLGIAADWLGRRKPFILAGILLSGLGAWVMGSSDSAQGLLVGRAITGLAAATWVPLTVLFSSLFPAQEAVRATAILAVAASIGRVTGTSVTGTLNNLGGYSLAFYLAVGVAGVAMVVLLPARERVRSPKQPSLRGIGSLITRRDVLLPSWLQAVIQYATWAVPLSFLPLLADQLGATDVAQSMLVSLYIAVVMMGSTVAAVLSKRFGARRLVYAGFAVLTAGIVTAAMAPALPVLFISQFLIGLSLGTCYPVLMGLSIRDVADAERATAMGLHQSVYAVGMFAGPWLSGILADAVGLRPMLGITALGCLGLALILLRFLPGRQAE
ncbi:MAG: MFS transporter [Anaerolineae bacterium]|jgi:MFS family permease